MLFSVAAATATSEQINTNSASGRQGLLRLPWHACSAQAIEAYLEVVKMINRGMAFLNGQPTTLVQKLAEVYRDDKSLVTVSSYRATNRS